MIRLVKNQCVLDKDYLFSFKETITFFKSFFIKLEITDDIKDGNAYLPINIKDFNKLSQLDFSGIQSKLLFIYPQEGFPINAHNNFIVKFLIHLTTNHSITPDRIFFLNGNLLIDKLGEKYTSIPKENFLGINIFNTHYNKVYDRNNPMLTKDELRERVNKTKFKDFIFRNGCARPHRVYLAAYLYQKNLLEKSYFSWLDFYKDSSMYTEEDSINYFFSKFNSNNQEVKKLGESYKNFFKKIPYTIDIKPEEGGPQGLQSNFNPDYTFSSYFSFVTETLFNEDKEDVLFLTEKTYQCFSYYHPFLIAGCAGTYKNLQEYGYQTFPELFDESFDDVIEPNIRIKKILNSLETFLNNPDKSYFKSEEYLDKLIHNKTVFLKRDYDNHIKKSIRKWLK